MIWLKIMGGILVVLSGCGLGFVRADKWRSHRKNLEELRKMTLLLRSQILYARGTLEEALEQVGKKSDGPVAQIFEETAEQLRCQDGRSFYEIWQMSVERHWKELLLTTEECREWKEFGRHLGFMDLELQEKNMERYLEQLELSVRFYREQEREQQKLSISLGIMGGLFLTVLLF